MINKKKIVIQFLIGSNIVGIIIVAVFTIWIGNFVPKKGDIVTVTSVKYLLEITPDIYIFKVVVTPPNNVSTVVGILFALFCLIGGLANIFLYSLLSKPKPITLKEDVAVEDS